MHGGAGARVRAVRSYFEVLEDMLIGFSPQAWTRCPLKRLVAYPEFHRFDIVDARRASPAFLQAIAADTIDL